MAEKELTEAKSPGNTVSVKYDNVLDKINRVTCDCDGPIDVKIVEGATEWLHTFQAGSGQSENVSETFTVTEDGEGNPSHGAVAAPRNR